MVSGHVMASCVRNIHTEKNLVIGFQVVENVADVFYETQWATSLFD